MIRKIAINAAFAGLCAIVGLIAYWWSDRDPPSYIIAMWVQPYELRIDDPFIIQEIFVRQRRCSRIVQHGFVQGDENYPLGAIDIPYPRRTGLIKQRFVGIVPFGMTPGPAIYAMTLVWICHNNPVSWFLPIMAHLEYPVVIR